MISPEELYTPSDPHLRTAPTTSDTTTSDDNTTAILREEHTFAWIANSLHIESVLVHLEKNGFDRVDDIVFIFIPYSTQNWQEKYATINFEKQ
mmetsp:Transcript_26200/g.44680  ORF Transcript_26200/g.44680 Transcript_26200/m.44680 type:complete len:93 (-) Transcript_26200:368-646(-)